MSGVQWCVVHVCMSRWTAAAGSSSSTRTLLSSGCWTRKDGEREVLSVEYIHVHMELGGS